MVSFVCGVCQDVLKKNKVDAHCEQKCPDAWTFICVDCTKHFEGFDYKKHTSCITEEQKYCGKFARAAKEGAKHDCSKGVTKEDVTKEDVTTQDGKKTEKRRRRRSDSEETAASCVSKQDSEKRGGTKQERGAKRRKGREV